MHFLVGLIHKEFKFKFEIPVKNNIILMSNLQTYLRSTVRNLDRQQV